VFNLSGTEIIFLLIAALVVLGPDKLPDALRRAGRAYGEFKKVSQGFQSEFRSAFSEPLDELRGTADLVKRATRIPDDEDPPVRVPALEQPGGAEPVVESDEVTAGDDVADTA
jgi:Sec-independent protein translocase protein TatA